MQSDIFKVFNIFLAFTRFKVVQTWFAWYNTWHNTLIYIYKIFELGIIKNNSYMVEIK